MPILTTTLFFPFLNPQQNSIQQNEAAFRNAALCSGERGICKERSNGIASLRASHNSVPDDEAPQSEGKTTRKRATVCSLSFLAYTRA